MKRSVSKHITLSFLVAASLLCSSCSYINNFIIINASQETLTVSYRFKPPNLPGAVGIPEHAPETKPVAQIDEDIAWQKLPSSRYKIDQGNRLVSLTLNTNEALRLTQCRPAHGASTGNCGPDAFFISEIRMQGMNGEIQLMGEQAHKQFVRDKNTYTLTYY